MARQTLRRTCAGLVGTWWARHTRRNILVGGFNEAWSARSRGATHVLKVTLHTRGVRRQNFNYNSILHTEARVSYGLGCGVCSTHYFFY
jgi:hypothetical protein